MVISLSQYLDEELETSSSKRHLALHTHDDQVSVDELWENWQESEGNNGFSVSLLSLFHIFSVSFEKRGPFNGQIQLYLYTVRCNFLNYSIQDFLWSPISNDTDNSNDTISIFLTGKYIFSNFHYAAFIITKLFAQKKALIFIFFIYDFLQFIVGQQIKWLTG